MPFKVQDLDLYTKFQFLEKNMASSYSFDQEWLNLKLLAQDDQKKGREIKRGKPIH